MRSIVSATLLEKLARHMALLACMAILFRSAGWLQTGQIAIWLLTVCASGFHLGARLLKRHQQTYSS
ncbi:MAG: hypothetical protein AB7S77_15050 [Desulfatirhabdiaceae bacterium]